MEWFRRADGSIAISEVAARPPGAQITTMVSRAHDIDFVQAWARLMIFGTFDPPERRYAAGAAFLRGQGQGRVRAVHGWEQVSRAFGELITDVKLPEVGQRGLSELRRRRLYTRQASGNGGRGASIVSNSQCDAN